MSEHETGKSGATSIFKDDSPSSRPATPTVRRVNYYFARPKEQTPTRAAVAGATALNEDFQQNQLKNLATNKVSNKIQAHDNDDLEVVEPAAAKAVRADTSNNAQAQAETIRTKKSMQSIEKDTPHNSRAPSANESEKYAGLKTLSTLPPKGCIFGKKTKANDIILDYDSKNTTSNGKDPLWCSEPVSWQRKPPFPKTISATNSSIYSADFLQFEEHFVLKQHTSKKASSKKLASKAKSLDFDDTKKKMLEILTEFDPTLSNQLRGTDLMHNLDTNNASTKDFKVLDMNPIPDLPGSDKLL